MLESVDKKLRHPVESLIAVLLFSLQWIPVVGPWMGPMVFPLATYFTSLLWLDARFLPLQIQILLFDQHLMLGQTVTITGIILFLYFSYHSTGLTCRSFPGKPSLSITFTSTI